MVVKILTCCVLLCLSLCCGGGGGAATSPSTSSTAIPEDSSVFYFIRYKESVLNQPTVDGGAWLSGSSTEDLVGQLDLSKTLSVAVKASETDFSPEFLMILKSTAPSEDISGQFNAVLYGLYNAQVTVGQYLIDFPTPTDTGPSFANVGVTNSQSLGALSEFPSLTEFEVSSTGAVSWGSWKGAVSGDGLSFILHRDKMFILASKRSAHSMDELKNKQFLAMSILQFEDSNSLSTVASGKGMMNFEETKVGGGDFTLTQTDIGVSVPLTGVTRPFNLNSEVSSLLEVNGGGGVTEQGFLGPSGFHVFMNPDNVNRPTLMVMFE